VTSPFHFSFSVPKKRSVSIVGHQTSFTLEDSFWHLLKHYANYHHVSVSSIVFEIDKVRGDSNKIGLSCLLRQFIINDILSNPTHYQEYFSTLG
jgi:predicted DNA-binding ribbon-helix-helix protein